MGKKKKGNVFLKILSCLFVVFVALLIANMSGYYEGKVREQVTITEDGIKAFEEALKNGEKIDLNSFLNNEKIDYSSNMSNLGDNITNGIESFISKGMKITIDILKSLF